MTEVINKEDIIEVASELASEGKFDRAIEEYKRILDVSPSDTRVQIKIAELHVKRRDVVAAVEWYDKVANSYINDGFFLKATTVYKTILRLNPSLFSVNQKLAEIYEKMGLIKDSVFQYQLVVGVLERKGDFEGALTVRKKIVELIPENIQAHIRLAESYQGMARIDEAMEVYENIVKTLVPQDHIQERIEYYEKILSYRPNNVEMLRTLCGLLYKRGEWKKLITLLDEHTQAASVDETLLAMYAEVYSRLNQIESSKQKYRELADLCRASGNVKGVFHAYRELLVVDPDEEESIAKEVADLGDNAKDMLIEAARKKRGVSQKETVVRKTSENAPSDTKVAENVVPEKNAIDIKTPAAQSVPAAKSSERRAAQVLSPEAKIEASYSLIKTYQQMDMKHEITVECRKIMDASKLINVAQIEPKILRIIENVKRLLGENEERAVATPKDSVPEAVDQVLSSSKPKKISFM